MSHAEIAFDDRLDLRLLWRDGLLRLYRWRVGALVCRGRDTAFAVPPAQIRTGGFPAYGSCLRW
jgi:hypothetical protein